MAHSRLCTLHYSEPRTPSLRSSRRRRKGSRGDLVSPSSCSDSSVTMAVGTVPAVNASHVPNLVEENFHNRPAESSSASENHNINVPSSVFLFPSAGQKLGHMLSLIRQEDVEFKHHRDRTQVFFPSKKGGSRTMLPLKARRLRSLIALAHHLDENDSFSRVPSTILPQPRIFNVDRNVSAVPSTA